MSYRRRLIMANNTKPYDAEVEYLQSDGVAYIDLQHRFTASYQFNLRCRVDDYIFGGVMGARYGTYTKNRYYVLAYNKNMDSFLFALGVSTLTAPAVHDAVHDIIYNDSSNNVYLDGNLVGTFINNAFTQTNLVNTRLFGANIYGDEDSFMKASIYRCTILVRTTGVVVMDLIPVRKDGVGYLYDKVSKQLFGHAAESGSFTYGNDK